eukprot:TRINITY_DN16153_c0_g2_i1.p1 TRINITY_DN16153_c0_g2~~TRINITY_DN16153_c0_g2_i1.p1  ORF type:complete len:226 (-),score=45.60 TRINITY_DN16153_c0_g2_i1:47-724(-)
MDNALELEKQPIFDFDAMPICIRNTFIEVALPTESPLLRRRSSSWSVGKACDVVDVKQLVSFSHRGGGGSAPRPCSSGKSEVRGELVPKQAVPVGRLPGRCDPGEVKICKPVSPSHSSEQSESVNSKVKVYAGTSPERCSLCKRIHDEAHRPRKKDREFLKMELDRLMQISNENVRSQALRRLVKRGGPYACKMVIFALGVDAGVLYSQEEVEEAMPKKPGVLLD